MSKQPKLKASIRTVQGRGSNRRLRESGSVPAVIYGNNETPRSLQVSQREISTLLSHAVGEHLLVDLEIVDGNTSTNRTVLLQEVQHNPLSREIVHVDLLAVAMDQTLEAAIPIEPVGIAAGVKNFGGILEQLVREVDIECLPKDLPEVLTVDVSGLGIGDSIHVKHLILPSGVTAKADGELTIFLVAAPRVEEAATAEVVAAAPEVIKEKKEATGEDKKA